MSDTKALTFSDFGLDSRIQAAIAAMGYVKPTPIQEKAIPAVLAGRDVMGAAQTGTGKTAGYGLPSLERVLPFANTSASPARHPVQVLTLAPTRELADQVNVNLKEYAKGTPLRVDVVYGGGLKTDNAQMLASIEEIDGGLIALTRFSGEIGFYPEEYLEIIRTYLGK